jgi:hypothetical protein
MLLFQPDNVIRLDRIGSTAPVSLIILIVRKGIAMFNFIILIC